MVMVHDCLACQDGDHDGHIDTPGPVPDGMIGGWKCECRGECRNRPKPPPVFIPDTIDYASMSAAWPSIFSLPEEGDHA